MGFGGTKKNQKKGGGGPWGKAPSPIWQAWGHSLGMCQKAFGGPWASGAPKKRRPNVGALGFEFQALPLALFGAQFRLGGSGKKRGAVSPTGTHQKT